MMKEIMEALTARIKSPVFGYFVFWWAVFNWRPLFYLFFSDTAVENRFAYFDKLTDSYSLLILPLTVASIMTVSYPWINLVFLHLCKKPTDIRNYLQAESEHRLWIRKKQLEEDRSALLAAKEKHLIDRARRDEEISSISDEETKERLRKEIDTLRERIHSEENSKSYHSYNAQMDLVHSYKQMADLLAKMGKLSESEAFLSHAIQMQRKSEQQDDFGEAHDEATKGT